MDITASYPVAAANGIAIVGKTALSDRAALVDRRELTEAIVADAPAQCTNVISFTATLAILLGIAGAAAGSFVALVSIRWPRQQPFLVARSSCAGCGQQLRAFELLPLLSYIALRGHCGRCNATIALRYPLIELASAAVGVTAALLSADTPHALVAALLGWWLLLLALLDGEHYWLPSAATLPLLGAGLAACAWLEPAQLPANIIGAAAGWAALAAVAAAYRYLRDRDGLGGGDIKLFAASGAWLGWDRLPLVLLGAALAALVGVLVWRRRFTATDRLPFGVFLAAATWAVYLLQP